MTDMPEQIWAKAEMEYGAIVIGLFADTVRYLPEGTMYRRADLLPKVKPLEWKQYEGDIFCAKTPWGCYFAQWDDEIGAFFSSLELGDHEDPIIIQPQDVASLSEAQDAAQADYETRILSALVQP